MKTRYQILIALMAMTGATACSFLEEEPQVICSDTFYKNEAELRYGLAGVYGALSNLNSYGNSYAMPISNTDDLSYQNRVHNVPSVYWYNHNASDTDVLGCWQIFYAGIKNANEYMAAIADSEFDPNHAY